jgi:multiple sugar transport system ATP-binding protein
MAPVTYENATRLYPGAERPAVDALTLDIADGEFLVLVGPSGCGKSTSLRMLAGLEEVNSGTIHIGDRDVTHLRPKERDIAMVFQSYALYPHMSVADNMGFALKIAGMDKGQIRKRIEEAAKILDLTPYLDRKPKALSGGQRQRVAMGRAIVREPQAFLMDEPLSNLDAKLRVEMRAEIARLQRDLAVTTIYVTHDQVEAITLGDRVAVMRDGLLQQIDTPQALYNRPVNLFVAEFIGSPAMNLVGADLAGANGHMTARFGEHELVLDRETLSARPSLSGFAGKRVILGIRPEDMEDAEIAGSAPDGRRIGAEVDIREDMGSELFVHFGVGARAVAGEDVKAALGQDALEATSESARRGGGLFVARVGRGSTAAEGSRIELVVDPSRLHFFDVETSEAIY